MTSSSKPGKAWFIRNAAGAVRGPFTSAHIQEFARTRKITGTTLIAKSAAGPWIEAGRVRGLTFTGSAVRPKEEDQHISPVSRSGGTSPALPSLHFVLGTCCCLVLCVLVAAALYLSHAYAAGKPEPFDVSRYDLTTEDGIKEAYYNRAANWSYEDSEPRSKIFRRFGYGGFVSTFWPLGAWNTKENLLRALTGVLARERAREIRPVRDALLSLIRERVSSGIGPRWMAEQVAAGRTYSREQVPDGIDPDKYTNYVGTYDEPTWQANLLACEVRCLELLLAYTEDDVDLKTKEINRKKRVYQVAERVVKEALENDSAIAENAEAKKERLPGKPRGASTRRSVYKVKYHVICPGPANVDYSNGMGGSTEVRIGGTKEFFVELPATERAMCTAVALDPDAAVSIWLYVDGRRVAVSQNLNGGGAVSVSGAIDSPAR